MFANIPYLSQANSPAGFHAGGAPVFLETFEDGLLNGGITASTGSVLGPGGSTDSVDADDGAIDGFGTHGHSFFSTTVRFTFSAPVTSPLDQVPLPAGLPLLAAGIGALGLVARRRSGQARRGA